MTHSIISRLIALSDELAIKSGDSSEINIILGRRAWLAIALEVQSIASYDTPDLGANDQIDYYTPAGRRLRIRSSASYVVTHMPEEPPPTPSPPESQPAPYKCLACFDTGQVRRYPPETGIGYHIYPCRCRNHS